MGNPGHGVAAGLLYATQLIQHLSLALDIYLPRQLDFTDFCSKSGTLSEYGLANKVGRLNLNVLYLCLSQGMLPEQLRTKQALYDLRVLLDSVATGDVSMRPTAFTTQTTDFLYQASVEVKRSLVGIRKTSEDLAEEGAEEERVYGRSRGPVVCAYAAAVDEGEWEDFGGETDMEAFPEMMLRSPSPSSASSVYSINSLVTSFMRGFGGGE